MKPKDQYQYSYGKLCEVIRRLTIGEGDVKSRLTYSSDYIQMIQKSMLPCELHEKWDKIYNSLTKFPQSDGRTDMQVTLRKIRNSTGSKIAQQLLNFQCDLSEYL